MVALGSLALSACQLPRFGAPDPASEQGDKILNLWSIFFVIAVIVTLFIWVPLIVVLVRNKRARDTERMPSQRAYNIPMEILYTAVPVLLAGALFFMSVNTERQVTKVSDEPAVRIEVIGFQWGWQFHYLNEDFTIDATPGELPEMVLPIGEASNLRLVSVDVNHSFWVPNFLSKRDLIPGVDNEITVTPKRAGTFDGRCAEFCGLDHWRMGFKVRLVPMDEYRAWAAQQRGGPGSTPVTRPTSSAGQGGGG